MGLEFQAAGTITCMSLLVRHLPHSALLLLTLLLACLLCTYHKTNHNLRCSACGRAVHRSKWEEHRSTRAAVCTCTAQQCATAVGPSNPVPLAGADRIPACHRRVDSMARLRPAPLSWEGFIIRLSTAVNGAVTPRPPCPRYGQVPN